MTSSIHGTGAQNFPAKAKERIPLLFTYSVGADLSESLLRLCCAQAAFDCACDSDLVTGHPFQDTSTLPKRAILE